MSERLLSRSRVLFLRELVAIWQAASDDDFGEILKLLSLTLQRKTEISDLQWDEIDLSSDAQLNLPEERTKNGLAHSVRLSGQADTILRTRKRRHGRQYVESREAARYLSVQDLRAGAREDGGREC